jgi:hypothetical protein
MSMHPDPSSRRAIRTNPVRAAMNVTPSIATRRPARAAARARSPTQIKGMVATGTMTMTTGKVTAAITKQ